MGRMAVMMRALNLTASAWTAIWKEITSSLTSPTHSHRVSGSFSPATPETLVSTWDSSKHSGLYRAHPGTPQHQYQHQQHQHQHQHQHQQHSPYKLQNHQSSMWNVFWQGAILVVDSGVPFALFMCFALPLLLSSPASHVSSLNLKAHFWHTLDTPTTHWTIMTQMKLSQHNGASRSLIQTPDGEIENKTRLVSSSLPLSSSKWKEEEDSPSNSPTQAPNHTDAIHSPILTSSSPASAPQTPSISQQHGTAHQNATTTATHPGLPPKQQQALPPYVSLLLEQLHSQVNKTRDKPELLLSEGGDDPLKGLKVFVYNMPSEYNYAFVKKDHRCLSYMFAAEVYFHHYILHSPARTHHPNEADWFYTPLYLTCDLTDKGLPLPFRAPRMMRSAIRHISTLYPFWNRTEGADHFFITPHDFGACFHFQEKKAISRGILPLLQRATLVQTFGQHKHRCHKPGSIVIPPYAPAHRMQKHIIPSSVPRSIFVYFRGLFYDPENDKGGGYYARGARASLWENFKENPTFDISAIHPISYYEDMRRSLFCLCPLGWAPWSPRLVESVVFGCIPVIIADDIILPFADVIPWKDIAVFVREAEVPRLDAILSSISPVSVLEKLQRLASPDIKRALLFDFPSQRGDAFYQVLSSLSRRLPHPSSAFLEPRQRILNWSAGPKEDFKRWKPRDPIFW